MAKIPPQYKSIISAAYSGMEIGPDWTKEQQKDLIRSSEGMLAQLTHQGETPLDALERIFAFYTPKTDPYRATWFMDLAQAKADELGISLDSRENMEELFAAASMPLKPSDDNKSHSGVGARIKEHTVGRVKEAFGPKQ